MMIIKVTEPYIVYSLSKDRTSQRFKTNQISIIVENLEAFLRFCTNTTLDNAKSIELTLYSTADQSKDVKIIDFVSERFGVPKVSPLFYHYPSGKPSENTKSEWILDRTHLLSSIEFLNSNQTPLVLNFSYSFELRDTEMNILPGQQFKSLLMIWLSRRSKSCTPTLFFPFTSANIYFWEYFDFINRNFPATLEEKYLRLAMSNKNNEENLLEK